MLSTTATRIGYGHIGQRVAPPKIKSVHPDDDDTQSEEDRAADRAAEESEIQRLLTEFAEAHGVEKPDARGVRALSKINPELVWRAQPHTFAKVVTEGAFRTFPHVSLIGRMIADEVVRGNGRLIVTLPPGHGKSMLISKWTPTWYLENWPEKRVILCSYGAALANDWGSAVRDEFNTNPYLTTELRVDKQAANNWRTHAGGGMVTAGVGGPVIGRRGNLIIIDDPVKNYEEAQSPIVRERVVNWFNTALHTRQEPDATIILLMHRMHTEDLAGYLIEKHKDPWKVVRLPAIAEPAFDPETGQPNAPDALNRQPGEALCPARYTVQGLEQFKTDRGVWMSMFQQRPDRIGTGHLYNFSPSTYPDGNVDKTVELRYDAPLHISFDFNRNPGMHVELGQYDTQLDLATAVHEIFGPYMKLDRALDHITKLVKDLGGWNWPEVHIFGDATGTQQRAETTLTAYQKIRNWASDLDCPVRFRVPAANPPVNTRIDTFNAALRDEDGEVHYVVNPRCARLIEDLKYMKEDEFGMEDKRDTKLSHASSAEGYRMCRIRPVRRSTAANNVGKVGTGRTGSYG